MKPILIGVPAAFVPPVVVLADPVAADAVVVVVCALDDFELLPQPVATRAIATITAKPPALLRVVDDDDLSFTTHPPD